MKVGDVMSKEPVVVDLDVQVLTGRGVFTAVRNERGIAEDADLFLW